MDVGIGPCDFSLVVLCSDKHRDVLPRCIASACTGDRGSLAQEVVVGVESKMDSGVLQPYVHEGCDVQVLRLGPIQDFAKARQRLCEAATRPWVMWLDADDTITGAWSQAQREAIGDYSPGLRPLIATKSGMGALIALAIGADRADANSLWVPYDYDVDDLEGGADPMVLERNVVRRAVRWGDGWEWVGRAYEDCQLVWRSRKELRVCAINLLVRRQPTHARCDVGGSMRRTTMTNGDNTPPNAVIELSCDLFRIAQRTTAHTLLGVVMDGATRSGNAHLGARASMVGFDNSSDLARQEAYLSCMVKFCVEHNPEYWRRRAAWALGAERGPEALDSYARWRSWEARRHASQLRFWDRVAERKCAHTIGAEAMLKANDYRGAVRALEEIPAGYSNAQVRHLTGLLRAQVGA